MFFKKKKKVRKKVELRTIYSELILRDGRKYKSRSVKDSVNVNNNKTKYTIVEAEVEKTYTSCYVELTIPLLIFYREDGHALTVKFEDMREINTYIKTEEVEIELYE